MSAGHVQGGKGGGVGEGGGGGVGLLSEGVLMARVVVVGISRGVSIHKKRRRGWDGVT